MKKIFCSLSVASLLIISACNNKPATVNKEVIVVPPAPIILVKEPAEKSTKVTLDKNGVKVETKKVEVKIGNK